MPVLITGAVAADVAIANALQVPTKGIGGGLSFPGDWLAQCIAGTRVPGCTTHSIEGTTMLVTPTVQTRIKDAALVASLGLNGAQVTAFKGRIAAGTYVASPGGGELMPMSPRKVGVACVPFHDSNGTLTNTWTLAQQQAALDDQLPTWWHNFQPTPEGIVSPPGSYFVPMLLATSDYTAPKIASAVANAEGNWIMGQGEPDGRGVSVAQAVANWVTLVTDPSIVANPQIKLVFPYQAGDGSAGGSYIQQVMAGVISAGCRLPDEMAVDRYSTEAVILAVLANYHAAFPTYGLWIPEFSIDTGAAGAGASYATESAFDQSIAQSLDRLSYVTHHAKWYQGPTVYGANNFTLRALYDTSAQPTPTAAVWRACGRTLPI